jgi:hypothetical protein
MTATQPLDVAGAPDGMPHERVGFAHNSERQLAKLLDFYGIDWAYEPTTFVLERDGAGDPTWAFSPDFYLPAYDLYVEVTTLRQKLVTKKNRKVRRLQELHPEVKVKILYQRDYLDLLVKYGLESPDQLVAVGGPGGGEPAAEQGTSLLALGNFERHPGATSAAGEAPSRSIVN